MKKAALWITVLLFFTACSGELASNSENAQNGSFSGDLSLDQDESMNLLDRFGSNLGEMPEGNSNDDGQIMLDDLQSIGMSSLPQDLLSVCKPDTSLQGSYLTLSLKDANGTTFCPVEYSRVISISDILNREIITSYRVIDDTYMDDNQIISNDCMTTVSGKMMNTMADLDRNGVSSCSTVTKNHGTFNSNYTTHFYYYRPNDSIVKEIAGTIENGGQTIEFDIAIDGYTVTKLLIDGKPLSAMEFDINWILSLL